MTGILIKLGKGVSIKDGKLVLQKTYQNASARIRAKTSKKVRVVRRTTP